MTRRTLTPAKKKRIAHHRHWRAPEGEPLALENGKVVLLSTGKPPEYDHAVQLALGGTDDDDNLRPLGQRNFGFSLLAPVKCRTFFLAAASRFDFSAWASGDIGRRLSSSSEPPSAN